MKSKNKVPAKERLKQLRMNLGASRVFRKFASKYDMVYFGAVHHDDEARLVRGLTQSHTQHDQHYCVGSAYGRDMIFVQRTNRAYSAYHAPEKYVWNILAVDMKDSTKLPSIYLEGRHRHGGAFHETLSYHRRGWVEVPAHLLADYDNKFTTTYEVRMANTATDQFRTYIPSLLAAQVAHYFGMFDYEFCDDTLYVYYLARQPSLETLDHMVKAGIWLAGEVESH